ncbi:hypothetical protein ACWD6N_37690, partial [Micromonospora sp. NPDC005163]
MAAVVRLRGRRGLRRFTVTDGGALRAGEVFGTCDAGSFDGVRVDDAGRVCVATHDGLHCFHLVGQSPERPASPDGAKGGAHYRTTLAPSGKAGSPCGARRGDPRLMSEEGSGFGAVPEVFPRFCARQRGGPARPVPAGSRWQAQASC